MLLKSTMAGSFLWQADDNAVFSYGDEHTPTFFTIDAQSWEDMGKPEKITILVTPGDSLNG